MDPEDRRLLIEMHGDIKSIVPELRANSLAVRSLDERVRSVEVVQGQQNVKVDRLGSDMDGAWKRIKSIDDRRQAQVRTDGRKGKLDWIIALLAAIPEYWHAVITVGSLVTAAAMLILKLHGGH